jgi:4-hydroxy-tetrahydrodipicolinate synthase
VPALTTPFQENGDLDLAGFRRLVDDVIGDGVHAILVNGCTGESWALGDDERQEVFRTAVEQAAGRVPVIVGCGAMTTRQAIGKVRQAERAAADAVMIQPPWYVMPSEPEVYEYYRNVGRSSPLPIVVYNIPRRTGVQLSVDLMDRLADEPTVVALKESSKDFVLLSDMVRRLSDRIAVFAGYASLFGLAAIAVGAVGYMDSVTPVFGRRSVEFYNAASRGDFVLARSLQADMAKLQRCFFGVGTFPAATKAALDLIGRPGGFPRDPIQPLSLEQREKIRQVLEETQLLPASAGRTASA